MLELRNYFTKYLVVVKAKKEEQRKERGVLERQQDYLNYIKGYGYKRIFSLGDHKRKVKRKTRKEKKRITLFARQEQLHRVHIEVQWQHLEESN